MTNNNPPLKIKIFQEAYDESPMLQTVHMDESGLTPSSNDLFDGPPISPSQLLHIDDDKETYTSLNTLSMDSSVSSSFDPSSDYLETPAPKRAQVISAPTYSTSRRVTSMSSDSELEEERPASRFNIFDDSSSLKLSPILLSCVSYFFCWLGALVLIFGEKKNVFVLFNAWQALIVGTFAFVVQFLFMWTSTLYTLLWIIYLVWEFGMIALLVRNAPAQRLIKMPVVGDWCEQRAVNMIKLHEASLEMSYQRFV